jgi:hypothetical protein
VEDKRFDETAPLRYQLPLPWEPPSAPRQTPPRTPVVRPQQVWLGLAPAEQQQLQQAVVRVMQEVLRASSSH